MSGSNLLTVEKVAGGQVTPGLDESAIREICEVRPHGCFLRFMPSSGNLMDTPGTDRNLGGALAGRKGAACGFRIGDRFPIARAESDCCSGGNDYRAGRPSAF